MGDDRCTAYGLGAVALGCVGLQVPTRRADPGVTGMTLAIDVSNHRAWAVGVQFIPHSAVLIRIE